MNLYVIYDMLAEESGPIYESKNDATALRQFKRVFEQRPDSEMSSFKLLRLGTIDHTSSRVTLEDVPEEVVDARKGVLA